jgi:zinc protease
MKMLRIRLPLAVFAFAASALFFVAFTQASAFEIKPITSPGGIKAWLVEEHSVPLIQVGVAFDGGSANDPKDKEGLAYFLSGMLDEGAGDLTSEQFQEKVSDLNVKLSFDADRDSFTASFATLTQNREESFKLLGLALSKPRFDKEPLERVRKQIIAILAQDQEEPETVAARAWFRAAFPKHSYGQPVKGDRGTISAITAEDLRGLAHKEFARDNMYVAIVGDVDAKEAGRLLDMALGALPAKAEMPSVPEETPNYKPGVRIIEKQVPQSTVIFGSPGIKRKDPDWYAAYVMNYVLGGGGFSSRLMDEIREKRGLTYGVGTSLYPLDHAGLILGRVASENTKIAESVGLIRTEIEKLKENGVTEKELGDAKTYLTGSYPLSFDTSRKMVGQLVGIQREGLGLDYVKNRNALIQAVTADQVKRVAARLLDPDNVLWVVVGDPKGMGTPKDPKLPPPVKD